MRSLSWILAHPSIVTAAARAEECVAAIAEWDDYLNASGAPPGAIVYTTEQAIRMKSLRTAAAVFAQLAVAEAIEDSGRCHECGASVAGHLHMLAEGQGRSS